jgi:hypothetical protein
MIGCGTGRMPTSVVFCNQARIAASSSALHRSEQSKDRVAFFKKKEREKERDRERKT